MIERDLCVAVLAEDQLAADYLSLLRARLDVHDNELVGSGQLNNVLDPVDMYLDRATRYVPLIAGLIGAIIAAIVNYLRTNEFASYRMSGTSKSSLGLIVFLEQGLICGFGFTSAIATVAILGDRLISSTSAVWWMAIAFTAWWTAELLLVLPVITRRPSRLAKDR